MADDLEPVFKMTVFNDEIFNSLKFDNVNLFEDIFEKPQVPDSSVPGGQKIEEIKTENTTTQSSPTHVHPEIVIRINK